MPETIEAEVIEIDGAVPARPSHRRPRANSRGRSPESWFQGRVVRFDRKWWPLWVLLAILVVMLAATVGLVFAGGYLVFAILRRGFRSLFGSSMTGSARG